MQHDRDRRAALLGGMKTAFQPTGGTVEKDFGHEDSKTPSGRAPGVRVDANGAACGPAPARECLGSIDGRLASEAAS